MTCRRFHQDISFEHTCSALQQEWVDARVQVISRKFFFLKFWYHFENWNPDSNSCVDTGVQMDTMRTNSRLGCTATSEEFSRPATVTIKFKIGCDSYTATPGYRFRPHQIYAGIRHLWCFWAFFDESKTRICSKPTLRGSNIPGKHSDVAQGYSGSPNYSSYKYSA